MTPTEAKEIIDVLAGGLDPETGEVLPPDNPINSPRVIRALFIAVRALEQTTQNAGRSKAEGPGKAGVSWTPEEDERLLAAADAGADVRALAKTHQRTKGAIRARLVRHGRLQAGGEEQA